MSYLTEIEGRKQFGDRKIKFLGKLDKRTCHTGLKNASNWAVNSQNAQISFGRPKEASNLPKITEVSRVPLFFGRLAGKHSRISLKKIFLKKILK